VKICDLYGNGWYYIPGSDTCLKFGGLCPRDLQLEPDGRRRTGMDRHDFKRAVKSTVQECTVNVNVFKVFC
jgi:hypothetical protein